MGVLARLLFAGAFLAAGYMLGACCPERVVMPLEDGRYHHPDGVRGAWPGTLFWAELEVAGDVVTLDYETDEGEFRAVFSADPW